MMMELNLDLFSDVGKEAYHNPLNINGSKSTVSHDVAEAIRQKYLPNPCTGKGKMSGGSNCNSEPASYKTSVKNCQKEVDILPETKSSDIDEKKAKVIVRNKLFRLLLTL